MHLVVLRIWGFTLPAVVNDAISIDSTGNPENV